MIIPLRAKYRRGFRSTFKGGENSAPRKHRDKIGHAKHVARFGEAAPRTLIVDGLTGKGRMADA